MVIIIKGDIPSKKNSKQIFINKKTGKRFITSSNNYKVWEVQALWQLKKYSKIKGSIEHTHIIFYPSTKREFDLSNKFESVADALVKAKILEDDSYKILKLITLQIGKSDKENPRVEIRFDFTTRPKQYII